jgi:hypothetical protein
VFLSGLLASSQSTGSATRLALPVYTVPTSWHVWQHDLPASGYNRAMYCGSLSIRAWCSCVVCHAAVLEINDSSN